MNALDIVCSEMLKLSRNKRKYQNARGPPEHSAIGNIYIGLFFWVFFFFFFGGGGGRVNYITTCHSKLNFASGYNGPVLSDGMVHFLKIEKI